MRKRKIRLKGYKKRAFFARFYPNPVNCPSCNEAMWSPNWNQFSGNPDKIATIDHIVPRHMGGNNNIMNLRLLCNKCNHSKAGEYEEHHKLSETEILNRLLRSI